MSYKQEIIFYTVGFPITCGFTIVLLFYDYLFGLESCCFKYFHNFAIMNNVCIRWMSTNKIYTHVRNKIKISCITLMNKYFTIGAFVLKVGLFPAPI